eukprot:CAMPEP_0181292334 /NCGR_PEP_ID=MMETSP1101-20121128/2452_1 /TAXON_ID=46948 /ORGANISM="Rhodomonas abbreviata, Strain Caron Lab Isolate" /LENGTH=429 /DNA_ID=CAMNT_0023396799 /DNA_START=199 /DNA_END=1488 /DNA_ORIENTATION=+
MNPGDTSLNGGRQKAEKVAVLGLGRLGLCFAVVMEQAGYDVVGMDVNSSIVEAVNERRSDSGEPGLADGLKNAKNLRATTVLEEAVREPELIFILVPTPNSGGRDYYNHSILSNLLFKLNELRLENKHIVISATVIPGYVHGTGKFLLRDCINTTLSYNPAFVAQGDIMEGYRTGGWFRLVLVGRANDRAGELLTQVYERIAPADRLPHICLMSPESAEIAKLSSNCFRTTKISFCNMVADLADCTPGADKHEICAALAKDESIGPIGMRPGYGYGGPCYPRDNQALALYAKQVGVDPCIPIATHEYNEFHHEHMAKELLSQDKEEYTFEDVAYKPKCAVAMIDESPKLRVALQLVDAGKKVVIRDRIAIVHEVMKEFGSKFTYQIKDEPAASLITRPPSASSSPAQLAAECANEGRADLLPGGGSGMY